MLMFNRPLRTRLDLLRPNLSKSVEGKQIKQSGHYRGSKTRVLLPNQPVVIRDYRSKDKWIEGAVVKQLSPTMFLVKLNSGMLWKHVVSCRSADRYLHRTYCASRRSRACRTVNGICAISVS